MKFNIEIAKESPEWNNYPAINENFLAEITKNILSEYSNFTKVKEFELSVLLTDDNQICKLNREFRNKNYATNVLSFPDLDIHWTQILDFSPKTDYLYLGDIAFSYHTIHEEADNFKDHFVHLFIHSILHLIGYDHCNKKEADVMESLEVKFLTNFNIASPY